MVYRFLRKCVFIGLALNAAAKAEAQVWLDPDFGWNGSAMTQFFSIITDGGRKVVVLPDGKVLVAGYIDSGNARPILLARFLPNGILDAAFGSQGVVTHVNPSGLDLTDMLLQPDGRIVVVGKSTIGSYSGFVGRFMPDGAFDPSFANQGVRIIQPSAAGFDALNGAALQPDGKIVAVGETISPTGTEFLVVRLGPDGSLDPSFGNNGIVHHAISATPARGYDVAISPSGRIVAAGVALLEDELGDDVAVARYMPDGALDASFDGDGMKTISWGFSDIGFAVGHDGSGRVIIGGQSVSMDGAWITASRLLANGDLDAGFGMSGTVRVREGSTYETSCRDLVVDASERILLAGSVVELGAIRSYLCRMLPDGGLDPTFGLNGELHHLFSGMDAEQVYGMALQPDGKIILTGEFYGWSDPPPTLFALRYLAEPLVGIIEEGPRLRLMQADALRLVFRCGSDDFSNYTVTDAAGRVVQGGALRASGEAQQRILFKTPLGAGYYNLTLGGLSQQCGTGFVIWP